MEWDEFRVAVTYLFALARNNGQPVATLWNSENQVVQVQRTPPAVEPTSIALPVVELLRSRGERMGKGFTVATTFPPTPACLGMARMCGIHKIFYKKGPDLVSVTTPRSGAGAEAKVSDAATATIPEVKLPTQPRLKWYRSATSPKDALIAWANECAANPKVGAILTAAKTMPFGGMAVETTFPTSPLEYLGMRRVAGGDELVMDNVLMMMAWEMISRTTGFKSNLAGRTLAAQTPRLGETEGQRIGSILADSEGNIVGWGFNTNKENATRHGEVNLIVQHMHTEKELPVGGTLYTTLEPCEMCSGMIVRAVKHGTPFRVIYGQRDANVHATALQSPPPGSRITMSATKAGMVNRQTSTPVVGPGGPVGFADSIAARQQATREIATTGFLKRKDVYEQYMAAGRPAWWMYLWDATVAQLEKRKGTADLKLSDPEVVRANADLTNIYELSEQFMTMVQRTAIGA